MHLRLFHTTFRSKLLERFSMYSTGCIISHLYSSYHASIILLTYQKLPRCVLSFNYLQNFQSVCSAMQFLYLCKFFNSGCQIFFCSSKHLQNLTFYFPYVNSSCTYVWPIGLEFSSVLRTHPNISFALSASLEAIISPISSNVGSWSMYCLLLMQVC